MFVTLSFLICIVGVLLYFFAKTPKVETTGLHMFWVGLLAFLLDGYLWIAAYYPPGRPLP